MKKWLRRIRGAIGMGLTWAFGWAVVGLLIGVASKLLPFLPWDSVFEVFDAPLPALAVPGFFGGALFSVVLGIAARRRRFADLSLPRFTAWGAVGGLLLSLLPGAMVAAGLATPAAGVDMWRLTAVISAPLTLLSAASAACTLLLARMTERRQSLEGAEDVADVRLSEDEERSMLGRGDSSLPWHPAQRPSEPARRDRANGPSDA